MYMVNQEQEDPIEVLNGSLKLFKNILKEIELHMVGFLNICHWLVAP